MSSFALLCSTPGEAFEHVVLFVIWVSLVFLKALGSFWAQMPGQEKTHRNWQKQL